MRKIFITLIILLSALTSLCAQENINIGYCHGEVSKTETVAVDGNTWVSGAVFLTKDLLSRYKGDIKAVRVGLVSKINIDIVQVWIRKTLDGENLASGEITSKSEGGILRGWNDIALTEPYPITGEDGLYIGFSYKQRARAGAMSVVSPGQENAFFAQMGSDAPWEDKSKTGTLSLEAVVYGEDLPQLDLGLLEATAQPDLQANLISVTATVHNTAMLTVSGFTTKTMLEGTNEEYTNHFDVEVEPYKTRQVSFTIPYTDDASIRNNIVLKIESLDDGTDAIADNNTVTANVSFARKVLIEEFTTEACINCPRVAKDLHEVMKLPQYENKIVAVCHHAGYYTDPFTQKCDEDLLFLYGGGGTYAPGMMWDRSILFGGTSPVITPDKNDIINGCNIRLEKGASSIVGIKGGHDKETGKVNVSITGLRKQNAEKGTGYLTVYLLEDNISSENQSGGGSNFKHQHVVRAYNNSFGEPIVWEDNGFVKDFSFSIEDGWTPAEMSIVAFIHDMDKYNPGKCEVDNAEAVMLVNLTSNIDKIDDAAETVKEEYYTVNGIQVSPQNIPEGVYIVRKTDSKGNVSSRKFIKHSH